MSDGAVCLDTFLTMPSLASPLALSWLSQAGVISRSRNVSVAIARSRAFEFCGGQISETMNKRFSSLLVPPFMRDCMAKDEGVSKPYSSKNSLVNVRKYG